ncbi:unnamed protein product [Protopolystoma xenopodis]|uniref:Uncharacterized protein n=1 Tax=Protopolystoma xenopodis TaxID=117903 RepID=A0A3S5FC51_9PLAT|nr:unnamed protein product [Protopolystoma xenopodis]
MVSGSDDVRQITDESSTRSHRDRRTGSQGLLRTIQQTRAQGNPPAVSGAANLRILSSHIFKQNERYVSMDLILFLNQTGLLFPNELGSTGGHQKQA